MSDIVDPKNGTHINRLTVVYHSIKDPRDQTPLATVVLVLEAGQRINRDQLRRELEQLHWIRDSGGQLRHQPYLLEDRYSHHSWGADAASLAFVIWAASTAVQGIVGGASWDGLKAIGNRIVKAAGRAPGQEALDDQEAIKRAKQIASAAFNGLDSSGFTVLSVSVADNGATVVMQYQDGSTFTVQPSMLEGGRGAIGPVVRAYPE